MSSVIPKDKQDVSCGLHCGGVPLRTRSTVHEKNRPPKQKSSERSRFEQPCVSTPPRYVSSVYFSTCQPSQVTTRPCIADTLTRIYMAATTRQTGMRYYKCKCKHFCCCRSSVLPIVIQHPSSSSSSSSSASYIII